ncbi:hypothetical protein BZG01_00030 [Labilibaculum manganireducens]|uniref:Uncharacterized protein n=1 Tax=Labilibaculum manganireducens TaxID=1940525 RepID=A0A2N3IGB3_9BACT|nr:hypothetical protein [Labilibaculum manganireducens]PKQ69360.1 hypothetical protein BZG01_00030 [Labilibaculum manganireducens]
MIKVTFEDKGQDFLWWKITDQGAVVDCGPFQKDIWCGSFVYLETVQVGFCIEFIGKNGNGLLTLNYKTEKIEETTHPLKGND